MNVRPAQFSWTSDWLPRARSLDPTQFNHLPVERRAIAIAQHCGQWQADVDRWLRSLSQQQQEDASDLVRAELEMLFEVVDPSCGYTPTDDDRYDFRQRWHEAVPLALAVQRCGFVRASLLPNLMRDLETLAARKRWLP